MDSPVIVDTASKFGRGIDLDSSFPGFPFEDDGFGRRSDIRAHLDDLASRHPEFADHLLGPPWGDIPFHGSLRNRRRGSGSGGSTYQGHPDEDARSQASGSSAASAASGASGVSSHGEPENSQDRHPQDFGQEFRRNPIPQYGLRNTVDIGQHHHNMENADKGNRGQRSMSAPPENRQSQQQQDQPQQSQQPQGQRFVSRVDITPQHNQPQQQQKTQQQPPQQQQQQKPQQQGNVRHIPIFVEGRDEPVIPKNVDDAPFGREPSPPQFHTNPPFHRSSPFGQHFGGRQHQWAPHFQDPFYQTQSTYEQPTRRQQPQGYQQPKQQYAERQRHEPQPQAQQQQPKQQQRAQPPSQPQQQQQQQQQPQQQQEPPKPKPALPKDPLERVALVQKEVDALAEQVRQYTGNSRKDKEYIYLDEMLTRELIKLDDIETEGRDNVRQARKNAIKSIQETISLLESKAPLTSQPQSPVGQDTAGNPDQSNAKEDTQNDAMDIDQKSEEQSQTKDPIPLPPGPSTPAMKPAETSDASEAQNEIQKSASTDQTISQSVDQAQQQQQQEAPASKTSSEPMDVTPAEKVDNAMSVDAEQSTENVQPASNENKKENTADEVSAEKKPENLIENQQPKTQEQQQKAEGQEPKEQKQEQKATEEKMEVDSQVTKSPKSPKKGKKAKKQTPVSEQPIPLPPPESNEMNSK